MEKSYPVIRFAFTPETFESSERFSASYLSDYLFIFIRLRIRTNG